ncbi:MAG: hypothetical protein JNK72_24595 [Myxococcales bacterium]|nr:hypothetical protein [Myxococcales bacterium]
MLTMSELARQWEDYLAKERNLIIYHPDDPLRAALAHGALLGVKAAGLPEGMLAAVVATIESASVTLPLGVGGRSLVLLSRSAIADPVTHMEVVGHEGHHDQQSDTIGHAQSAVDYILSLRLRAAREADAYAVGLFIRYVLTGYLDVESAVRALRSDTYDLDGEGLNLAEGFLRSHLATIGAGLCPNLTTARLFLTWLRQVAPERIVPALAA